VGAAPRAAGVGVAEVDRGSHSQSGWESGLGFSVCPARQPTSSNSVIWVFIDLLTKLFHVTELCFNGANVLDSYEGIIKVSAGKLLHMK